MSEITNQDPPTRPIAHLAQSPRSAEEDRAWAKVYAVIYQPAAAEEVVKQLDADPQAKRDHLALYIQGKTTLRERRVIEIRNQRIAAYVRLILSGVVLRPACALTDMLAAVRDITVACMPALQKEPATARARKLMAHPDFASSIDRFASATSASANANESLNGSRKAA